MLWFCAIEVPSRPQVATAAARSYLTNSSHSAVDLLVPRLRLHRRLPEEEVDLVVGGIVSFGDGKGSHELGN